MSEKQIAINLPEMAEHSFAQEKKLKPFRQFPY
jgi:hypothetical protein